MIISPTGLGIRNDPSGNGAFNAPRGTRRHNGIDFTARPGQLIICPISQGQIIRIAKPYDDDDRFSGVLIENIHMSIKLFYFRPFVEIVGKIFRRGQAIGIAQDIREKYGEPMLPHVHLELDRVDPWVFIEIEAHVDALNQVVNWGIE